MPLSKKKEEALSTIYKYIQDYLPKDGWFDDAGPAKELKNYPTVTTSDNSARYVFSKKLPIVSERFYLQDDPFHGWKRMYMLHEIVDDGLGFGYEETKYYLRCSNPIKLARWIHEASPFIISKEILFIPEIISIHKSGPDGGPYEQSKHHYFPIDTTKMRFKVFNHIPAYLDDARYLPLFKLTLPYIERLDLRTLKKVFDDHPDELLAFRSYMNKFLDTLEENLGSERMEATLRRSQRELDDGARMISAKYRHLKVVSALRVTSAAVLSWGLVIYTLICNQNGIVSLIGSGGSVMLLSKEISDHLKNLYELKENNLFLLAVAREKL